MNKRRIQEHLVKVHKDWIDSIKNEDVKKLAMKNTIITGGAITSLLQGKEPKDYDIYFTDKQTTLAVATYYVEIFNTKAGSEQVCVMDGHRYFQEMEKYPTWEEIDRVKLWWFTKKAYNMSKDRIRIFIKSSGLAREFESKVPGDGKKKPERFRPVFMSSNAITLSDKIQLINRFYGPPKEIHKTFDFIHTFNYWRSDTKELVLNLDALEAILDRRLVYKGSKYPLCSVIRMRKFMKRGWTINAGQILKMCFQLSQLDLTNVEVLEDQLIGVDTAYFSLIIHSIQRELETNKDFRVDEHYVVRIVDEVFG